GSSFPIGTTTVTSTATDAAGNKSTCTFTVTVNDTEKPVISCPSPMTVSANGNCQTTVPDITGSVTVSDNCQAFGPVTVTQSPLAGTPVGLGTTIITVTATDAAGNSSSCSVPLTVNGNVNVIQSDFNGTPIKAGNYVWFNSVFVAKGLGSTPVT